MNYFCQPTYQRYSYKSFITVAMCCTTAEFLVVWMKAEEVPGDEDFWQSVTHRSTQKRHGLSGESTKNYFEHLAGQQYELNQGTLSAAFSLADAIFHRAAQGCPPWACSAELLAEGKHFAQQLRGRFGGLFQ